MTTIESTTEVDRHSLVVMAATMVFLVGIHIDGWAHNHGRVDESFFTPWHAALYGGYLLAAIAILRPIVQQRARGVSWRDAIPDGYTLSVAGVVVFAAGGVGDMFWHIAFGIEEDIDALLSPTHLTLAVGGALMAIGPFLSGWRRRRDAWSAAGPTVVAVLAWWAVISFMTQYVNPYVELWPTADWQIATFGADVNDLGTALGVTGFMVQSALLTGFVLVLADRGVLPRGGLFLLIGVHAGFAVTQGNDYWLVTPVVIGALVAEWLFHVLRPLDGVSWRVFSFALPATVTTALLAGMASAYEIAWSTHLWSGTIVISGLVGLLVGLLVRRPAI